MNTFLWYDLETFGTDKSIDRIAQAAFVRTDTNFSILSEKVLYCRIPDYYFPHPEACLVNGITPQFVNRNGLSEAEFAEEIQKEITTPNTVIVGFNNLEFDDNFLKSLFFRTLFNPYEFEWVNTKWDILNLAKAMHDLRPQGMNWPPLDENKGFPVFRLTELTDANGINQEGAHDALVDVKATIAIAKQIRRANPKMFSYYFETRTKEQILAKLKKDSYQIFLLTQFFHNEYWKTCTHPMMPLFFDDLQKPRTLYCYDLLLGAPESIEQAQEKNAFVKIPLNKYPSIAPLNVLPDNSKAILGFDKQQCLDTVNAIKNSGVFDSRERVLEMADSYLSSIDNSNLPPEVFKFRAFVPNQVYRKLASYKAGLRKGITSSTPEFPETPYYKDSVICYVANNYPTQLTNEDRVRFETIRKSFLLGENQTTALSLESFINSIKQLSNDRKEESNTRREILDLLSEYAKEKNVQFQNDVPLITT